MEKNNKVKHLKELGSAEIKKIMDEADEDRSISYKKYNGWGKGYGTINVKDAYSIVIKQEKRTSLFLSKDILSPV